MCESQWWRWEKEWRTSISSTNLRAAWRRPAPSLFSVAPDFGSPVELPPWAERGPDLSCCCCGETVGTSRDEGNNGSGARVSCLITRWVGGERSVTEGDGRQWANEVNSLRVQILLHVAQVVPRQAESSCQGNTGTSVAYRCAKYVLLERDAIWRWRSGGYKKEIRGPGSALTALEATILTISSKYLAVCLYMYAAFFRL